MKEIRTTQELNEILGSGKSAFIKIGAPWCNPCSIMSKTISNIEGDYIEDYNFCEINADEADDDIVNNLGIYNLPTIILYNKKGEEVYRCSGLLTKPQLVSILNDYKDK